jgi:hypothetical protein
MEFQSLGEQERIILLSALDFDFHNLKCDRCGVRVSHKRCSIMPGVETEKRATILCEFILCLTEYLELAKKVFP